MMDRIIRSNLTFSVRPNKYIITTTRFEEKKIMEKILKGGMKMLV